MESGTSRGTGCGRVSLLVMAAAVTFLGLAGIAGAQQPAGDPQSDPSNAAKEVPSALPAVQTPAQAAASAAGAEPAKNPDAAKDLADQSGMVKLGPADLVEVNVYNVPELTSKVRVSNSGDVYLPLIDYIHVAGLTQEEAQTLIEKRLSDGGFVRNPHVTIFVDEAASQGVTIIGEVLKAGIYPDVADHKLYEVHLGGGWVFAVRFKENRRHPAEPDGTDSAGPSAKSGRRFERRISTSCREIRLRFHGRRLFTWWAMWAGRAGCWWIMASLTVLQALALAGGANRTAKLGAARIIRKDGRRE